MDQSIECNLDLIKRYDKSGPRYTSYPTAVQFTDSLGVNEYQAAVKQYIANSAKPLSLYFHLPFCATVCYYCGCNKIVTKKKERATPYLERLYKEIEMQALLCGEKKMVDQLHWGGGTPTFLSHQQMQDLMGKTAEHFQLKSDGTEEYSLEVDPREASPETIAVLAKLGFNRLSMGLQDFDPKVQKAVNRIQSEEQTFSIIQAARENEYKSISVDLIYGLPHQTVDSFTQTLEKVMLASPDRLSVFNYAHLPEIFKPQRRINEIELPSSAVKLHIMQQTIDFLLANGYVFIGMDHFAKPDDELAIAQREGTLHRNFQGYSTHADCDLLSMGVSSISKVGNIYAQNQKTEDEYYAAIDKNQIPVFRGVALHDDDIIRREVITQLICHFQLTYAVIEKQFNINFAEYFSTELAELAPMQKDGLVTLDANGIRVSPQGKLLIRNICMVFDFYMRQVSEQRFSKLI